jgi:circadian clock protein KaiB
MSKPVLFKFRLYVAIANLRALCRDNLAERHEIEIVDVLRDPKLAMAAGVLLTPMLVRVSPAPTRKIIGDLSESRPLLQMLELPP